MHTMTKRVPTAQYVDDKTQDMFPIARNDNANGTCTTSTMKSDSFDEKIKNSLHHLSELY